MQIQDLFIDLNFNEKKDKSDLITKRIESKLKSKNDHSVNDIPSDIRECLNSVIRNEGYIHYRLEKRKLSSEGGNFLGILHEIDITGFTLNSHKVTNLFVKTILPNVDIKTFSLAEAFYKESFAYKDLLKIYTELQEEAKVPEELRLKMVKCYNSHGTALILENLKVKGFKMYSTMESVTLPFAKLAMEQLAKLHGLSYVLQKKRPEYFNRELKPLKYLCFFNDDWKSFIKKMSELCSQNLDVHRKKKVESFLPVIWKKFPRYMEKVNWVGSVVCHGDYRVHNIMMKEVGNEIKEAIPIDYQFINYNCPLHDFFYFIFLSTDKKFRNQHLSHLKDFYYEHLGEFLKLFNYDIEDFYPKEQFERQYSERIDYGLMEALNMLPIGFAVGDNIPEYGEIESNANLSLDKRFQERIEGIIDDFIMWGYL